MTLWDLNERLSKIVEGKEFEREMWRYIKEELSGVLLFYQNRQLFELSIGADKYPLGFYRSPKNIKKKFGVSYEDAQDPGTAYPFNMVNTGSFKKGMMVFVDRRSHFIEFTSTTPHLQDMLDNDNNQFITTNFFGLIYKHQTNIINLHILPHMTVWNIRFLQTGKTSR